MKLVRWLGNGACSPLLEVYKTLIYIITEINLYQEGPICNEIVSFINIIDIITEANKLSC